jgi:Flp pilus assembly protein TadD
VKQGARFQDLLPPDQADAGVSDTPASDKDWGDVVLSNLRHLQSISPAGSRRAPLPPSVADALLAWAVSCYETRQHADANLLLEELLNRQLASVRLLKAYAANLLALGYFESSAASCEKARMQTPNDPELFFLWGQAEWFAGHQGSAQLRLRQAITLFEQQGVQPPSYFWCRDLTSAPDLQ